MDALILRLALVATTLCISTGASYRTRNFVVTAQNSEEAERVGEAAEEYRRRLAIYWTGEALPNWSRPCTLSVKSGSYGAGGQTTFQFVGNDVLNWRMSVQGSLERILDSVLPHEVNHTIFACYFRRPLPRWADEGAATLFEHRSEQRIQLDLLQRVVKSGRGFIPLSELLNMKEYPTGRMPMLTLYAEGFGLVDFLMHQGGRHTYLKFLTEGKRSGWEPAIRKYYNHNGVEALEKDWRGWVMAGMPHYGTAPEEMIALIGAQTRDVARPATRTMRVEPPRSDYPEKGRQPSSGGDSSNRGQQGWNGRQSSRDSARQRSATSGSVATSLQAPVPVPPDSERRREPESNFFETSDDSEVFETDFHDATNLEPTNHRDENPDDRRLNSASLPWKRTEESGSTPQWAGFPGQKGLF
jgi:hypothetical protein